MHEGNRDDAEGTLQIELLLHSPEPPHGIARAGGHGSAEPVPFSSWLGLIRALVEVIARHGQSDAARPAGAAEGGTT